MRQIVTKIKSIPGNFELQAAMLIRILQGIRGNISGWAAWVLLN